MTACYLADPLGSGLLSLKFLVLEAAELSALDKAEGGKGFVFLEALGALISAFREGGGVCGERGAGEGEQSCETYPSHATSPQLRAASGWLRGPWWLGPQAPGLQLEGECRAPSHRGSLVGVRWAGGPGVSGRRDPAVAAPPRLPPRRRLGCYALLWNACQ